MKKHKLLAGCGVPVALALALGGTALAAGGSPTVTVRVEGVKRTLLGPTAVKVHAGSLRRFGAPAGKCPDKSAAGALNVATHHRWKATWESSFDDYEVTSILGEAHTFSSKDYWEIFVNNVAAQMGACAIKIKPGEQILFAAVPQKGAMPEVLLVGAPAKTKVGSPMRLIVRARVGHRVRDIAGAEVTGGGLRATTDSSGKATLTPRTAGILLLHATKKGFVRGAVKVNVS
jgi:hypothetical protein